MKKRWIAVLSAAVFLLSACGKNGEEESPDPLSSVSLEGQSGIKMSGEASGTENAQSDKTILSSESAEKPERGTEANFGLENLHDRIFYFSSGAGGWSTELYIDGDGSFSGNYHDSEMGDTGEDYPDGSMYISVFSGTFEGLEKVDDFTYKMKMTSLQFEQIPETEEIQGGVRWIYSTAYGLDGGEDFYLYLPGAPLNELPEEYLQWVGYTDPESISGTELPFYGLYNLDVKTGFSSYQYDFPSLSERVDEEIAAANEVSLELEQKLQAAKTQADMNTISAELYETWDAALNAVWKILESELDGPTMEALRVEEREWIALKEEQVTAAGLEYEDGSMRSMTESITAAEMTKERVYQLQTYTYTQ